MRMAHSSIIRESEDFGAAIIDRHGRGIAELVQSTPLQSGPLPGYVRGMLRVLAARGEAAAAGRRDHAQRRLCRRQPRSGCRLHRAGVSRRHARRLHRDHGASPRHRRADPRQLRHRRCDRRLCRGAAVQRHQGLSTRGGGNEPVWHMLRDNHPRVRSRRRRYGGPGRCSAHRRRAAAGTDRTLRSVHIRGRLRRGARSGRGVDARRHRRAARRQLDGAKR